MAPCGHSIHTCQEKSVVKDKGSKGRFYCFRISPFKSDLLMSLSYLCFSNRTTEHVFARRLMLSHPYKMLQPIYNLTPQQIFQCRSLTAASLATLLSQSPMRICLASPQRSKFAQELGWCSPRSCCLECAVAAVPEEKEVHAGLNLL